MPHRERNLSRGFGLSGLDAPQRNAWSRGLKYVAMGFLVMSFGIAYLAWVFWFLPYGVPPFPRKIEVPSGRSLRELGSSFHKEGVLLNPHALCLLAWLKGAHREVRAGIYRIEGPISASRLLDMLTKGEAESIRVTIPEGWTLTRIADRLGGSGVVNPGLFLKAAKDATLVSELLGFEAPSLEGFLFPDTYFFPPGAGELVVLRTMLKRFNQAFDHEMKTRARELGLSVVQAVTLASIIEKETASEEEKYLISGVFHKRLRLGMKLESDPTVIYGLEGFAGSLKRQDLLSPHPYNTYVHYGLPPGPICNPGEAALKAALFPRDTDYLYFVSRKDGTHEFSRTLNEHLQAVSRYQKSKTVTWERFRLGGR